ncbi:MULTISPECIES: hypothetical protein [Flavobacterium]|uniref:Uncharacterized protein n=1 Tax=Flavobacterium ranwuense TaxID=2541725 RepID=A0ABY2DVN2_9FLAO|nr:MULTISPECIES: hypothetical protein [Flavobacterium]TDE28865.1 hypothetical protein E0I61_10770 [Flavobacterium ranwuense]TDE52943.1 hypothetical protein E0H99_09675 [Flavobacterium sp. GT3P67]
MKSNTYINEESLQKFTSIIANKIHNGFIIIERNDTLPFAVLSKGRKEVDHTFNFFLFCVTLGLWSVAWIYLTYVSSKEKNIVIAIDEDGNTFEEKCYLE